MAKEKPLDLGDVEAYEEWTTIPQAWRCLGKKDVVSKTGKPLVIVVFDDNGTERAVFSWALRREQGKQFEILKRILPQYTGPPARV